MTRLAAVLASTLLASGCSVLYEPLEQSLLYRPRPPNAERLAALAREQGVEEVRIAAADGVRLHGFLKHALLEDAKHVYDWAAARADVDAQNIVLLGRSLGAYVAVSLASARPVRAAILATPFDSLAAIGEKRYPLLPIGTLLNGRYDTASLAPAIRVPALFGHRMLEWRQEYWSAVGDYLRLFGSGMVQK